MINKARVKPHYCSLSNHSDRCQPLALGTHSDLVSHSYSRPCAAFYCVDCVHSVRNDMLTKLDSLVQSSIACFAPRFPIIITFRLHPYCQCALYLRHSALKYFTFPIGGSKYTGNSICCQLKFPPFSQKLSLFTLVIMSNVNFPYRSL